MHTGWRQAKNALTADKRQRAKQKQDWILRSWLNVRNGMQVLTEERGECRPVLERAEPVVALHEGLAQRARTGAAAAVDRVHAVAVRGRRLAR